MTSLTNTQTVAEVAPIDIDGLAYPEVIEKLRPVIVETVEPTGPLPVPREITQEHLDAIDTLAALYGAVLTKTQRKLTEEEIATLIDEKEASSMIAKIIAERNDDMKTMVFNHLDQDAPVDAPRNERGHALTKGELAVEGRTKKLVRELRTTKPKLTAEGVGKLYDDGVITEEEYNRMTTEVTTVHLNEDGVIELAKERPEILAHLAKVIEPGTVTAAFGPLRAK